MAKKKKKKRKGKSDKGGPFERETCGKLSKWWTGSDDESVFWRTSQSGGRATLRRRKGKKTSGQCGDICSIHPSSRYMTELFTIECKRGYGDSGPGDMMDRPKVMRNQQNQVTFEKFLEQTIIAHVNEKTPFWMLIHRRDKHESMVYFPARLRKYIEGLNPLPMPSFEMDVRINVSDGGKFQISFVGMTLRSFLTRVTPKDIKRLWRNLLG